MKQADDSLTRRPVHPFPARMAPSIALEAVGQAKPGLRVLDPMMGSGTVLAVAKAAGHHALGVDTDPLAVLMTRVWTSAPRRSKTTQVASRVLDRAEERFRATASSKAYPRSADDPETREFIDFWFDSRSRKQLWALSESIRRTHDRMIRDVLWCAFSRLIITKQAGASRAMDLSHSRPHRAFDKAPLDAFDSFERAVSVVLDGCLDAGKGRGPRAFPRRGDARDLAIPSGTIDLAVTSPPYLNAIDYLRASKFSLVWMGYRIPELREVRTANIGTQVRLFDRPDQKKLLRSVSWIPNARDLSVRDQGMLARYVVDLFGVVSELSRVVRSGGRLVTVVGDSAIRGTYVRNSLIIRRLAESQGFAVLSRRTRELPPNRRYLPPPSGHGAGELLATRMRREVVLTFERAA